uniref:Ion_trans domain-containing protein n=1 Tax=Panagrellus redivivus TaxID=6233 RepID=A0A7E4ZX99_PANRE
MTTLLTDDDVFAFVAFSLFANYTIEAPEAMGWTEDGHIAKTEMDILIVFFQIPFLYPRLFIVSLNPGGRWLLALVSSGLLILMDVKVCAKCYGHSALQC